MQCEWRKFTLATAAITSLQELVFLTKQKANILSVQNTIDLPPILAMGCCQKGSFFFTENATLILQSLHCASIERSMNKI